MKKFLGIVAFALVCVLCVGCGANNNAKVKLASQKLSNGIDKIVAQVKKMDNVDVENLDISNMLGDWEETSENEEYSAPKDEQTSPFLSRRGEKKRRMPLKFEVPTQNKFAKNTSANLAFDKISRRYANLATNRGESASKRKKNFNFVSREAEKKYGSLYTACNNCCEASSNFDACKSELLKNCSEAKKLLDELAKSGKSVEEADLKALNGYYEVLSSCLGNLQNCKSCSKNVKMLGKKRANLAKNFGAMKADYLQIFNCLDNNCCSCENANASVVDLIDFVGNLLGKTENDNSKNDVANKSAKSEFVGKSSLNNNSLRDDEFDENFDFEQNRFQHRTIRNHENWANSHRDFERKNSFEKNRFGNKIDQNTGKNTRYDEELTSSSVQEKLTDPYFGDEFASSRDFDREKLTSSSTSAPDDEFANKILRNKQNSDVPKVENERNVENEKLNLNKNNMPQTNNQSSVEQSHLRHIYPHETLNESERKMNQSNASQQNLNKSFGETNNFDRQKKLERQNKVASNSNSVQTNSSNASKSNNLQNDWMKSDAKNFENQTKNAFEDKKQKNFLTQNNAEDNANLAESNLTNRQNTNDFANGDEKELFNQKNKSFASNQSGENKFAQNRNFGASSGNRAPRIVKTGRGTNRHRFSNLPTQSMTFAPKNVRARIFVA